MADWALISGRPDLWNQMEPQYRYVQKSVVESMKEARNNWRYHVRLVLETGCPGIFRVGDLEDFPGVRAEDLNCAVMEMIGVEREKAMAVFGMLKAHPEAVEERLAPLRAEAVHLFHEMEKAEELELLNAAFNRLTDEEQRIRYAYSVQNPWMMTFMKPGTSLTHETAVASIDHIRIAAEVTDEDWLAQPIYPSAGTYNKGMKTVIGVRTPWETVEREKDGHKVLRRDSLIYTEPRLTITGIIPVPRFHEYRDYLPGHWLEPGTEEEKAAAAAAREEGAAWVLRNGAQDVPCFRKRRKNRS